MVRLFLSFGTIFLFFVFVGCEQSSSDGSKELLALAFSDSRGGGTDPGELPPSEDPPRILFITSSIYNGNLGGVSGADFRCSSTAGAGGLSGTFQAIISTSAMHARGRMPNAKYVTTTGETVAHSISDLFDGTIETQIRNEQGNYAPSSGTYGSVWTGTKWDGYYVNGTNTSCKDWTSSSNPDWGEVGFVPSLDSFWVWVNTSGWAPCDVQRALYCFQASL